MHDSSALPFNATMQIWVCGNPEHHHSSKEEADGCIRKRAVAVEAVGPRSQVGGSVPAGLASEGDPATRVYWPAATGIDRWASADDLAKVHGQSNELVKMVTELSGVIGRIAKQVDDIARTPLPPQTLAYPFGFTGVSKKEDSGRARAPASDEDIVERFAKLSPTEQTMLLIKAAYRNPMRPGGIGQTDGDPT